MSHKHYLLLASLCCFPETVQAEAFDNVDEIVVTAGRSEQKRVDVATSLEIVSAERLDQTFGLSFIDLLKKTASLDVIQYPNGLAGIGLRGLRPDFEFTINPRTLVLVDGRPSGSTSFTTISPESIARVEVLKGPASSLYGASAVGGVVNIITRRSTGPLAGQGTVGYGSFDTLRAGFTAGGTLAGPADFDIDVGYVNQRDDFRAGFGDTRPNSDFRRLSGRLRVGTGLGPIVRIDSSIDYADLDNNAPGPLSFNPQSRSGNETDRLSGDLIVAISPAAHEVRLVGYASRERYNFETVPVKAPRFLSSVTETRNRGLQLQDRWTIAAPLRLTYGFDYQKIEAERLSYNADGSGRPPFSPNESRTTKALFTEAVLALLDDRLILTAGARYDWLTVRTLETPLRPGFRPGTVDFGVFNPRGGAVFKLNDNWRLRGTWGRAFVPAQGSELAGENEEFAGRQRRIAVGNPDLRPERNTSWDVGFGYANEVVNIEATYFDSRTRDRIVTLVVIDTPTLRQTSYFNSNSSAVRGLEGTLAIDAGSIAGTERGRVLVNASVTHLIEAEDILAAGPTPIRNVADWKANLSATVTDGGALSGTVTARYNGARIDTDNSQGRILTGGVGGLFTYDNFTVVDLSGRWAVTPRDVVRIEISNVFDKDYIEKGDYPMMGRAAHLRYSRRF